MKKKKKRKEITNFRARRDLNQFPSRETSKKQKKDSRPRLHRIPERASERASSVRQKNYTVLQHRLRWPRSGGILPAKIVIRSTESAKKGSEPRAVQGPRPPGLIIGNLFGFADSVSPFYPSAAWNRARTLAVPPPEAREIRTNANCTGGSRTLRRVVEASQEKHCRARAKSGAQDRGHRCANSIKTSVKRSSGRGTGVESAPLNRV